MLLRAAGKVYISASESSALFLATEWYRNFHTFYERTSCAPSIMSAWQTSNPTMYCQQKFQMNLSQLHSFSLPGGQVQCPVIYIILLLCGKEKVEVFLSSTCVLFPFFESDCWVDLGDHLEDFTPCSRIAGNRMSLPSNFFIVCSLSAIISSLNVFLIQFNKEIEFYVIILVGSIVTGICC